MFSFRPLFIAMTFSFLAGAFCSVNARDSEAANWPETIVVFENLRPVTPFKLHIPGIVAKGHVNGPTVLRAHITAEGTVSKVGLMESCENPDLDEAAIHAMRVMKFRPYTFGGTPIAVTLVLPVHIPKNLGRSR